MPHTPTNNRITLNGVTYPVINTRERLATSTELKKEIHEWIDAAFATGAVATSEWCGSTPLKMTVQITHLKEYTDDGALIVLSPTSIEFLTLEPTNE